MGPGGLKGAGAGRKLRVTLEQGHDRLARFRHHRDDGKLKTLVRRDRDPAAQTEDRIEHGADTVR